jgi:hypothetical protein
VAGDEADKPVVRNRDGSKRVDRDGKVAARQLWHRRPSRARNQLFEKLHNVAHGGLAPKLR